MKFPTTAAFAIPLTATGLLLAGTVLAQEVAEPADPAETEAAVDASFSDAEIESYASAAIEMQDVRSDTALGEAEKREMAIQIVNASGIDVETYTAISEAMQNDPEVAQRVQLAVANLRGQPEG